MLNLSLQAFGQTKISIVDEGNYPVPSVHITLFNKQGKQIAMQLTNNVGVALFSKETLQGQQELDAKISFIGFETKYQKIQPNQNYNVILKESNVLLNQVVVTAQYSANSPEKAVHKIEIIDRKKIDAMGAINLEDVLSNSMGIRIEQDNVLGSGISLQGLSGQNVKILIDGIPVVGRLNGNIDLSQINLDNIDRIEIVNGPLSVNYGTNALAGTINIITKKSGHPGFNGSILGMYQSVGNYNLSGNMNYRWKNNTIKLSGGRKYFDGWSPNSDFFSYPHETPADTNRSLQWNPKIQKRRVETGIRILFSAKASTRPPQRNWLS